MGVDSMFIIGADIGTTSTKAIVFDRSGQILGSHSVEYPLYTPNPGWAEQDLFTALRRPSSPPRPKAVVVSWPATKKRCHPMSASLRPRAKLSTVLTDRHSFE
jgi:predicted NBD/HSP70 family sugar kinase